MRAAMQKGCLIGLATLLSSSVALSGNGEAIDASWLTKAREGAKAVYDKYEKLSARLEGEYEDRGDFMPKPSKPIGGHYFESQSRRERIIRLDENTIVENVRILDSNPKQPQTDIRCENKDYRFTLSKSGEDDAYVLRGYELRQRELLLRKAQKTSDGLHNLVFWYLDDILAAINNKDKYSLRKLQFDAGKQLLVIEYNRSQGETLAQNQCYIDPSHDWRVVEYRREYPDSVDSAKFDYGFEVGGVEFPIKYKRLTTHKRDSPYPNARSTCRLLRLKITDKKPEDFRMAAFGFPEPIDAPPLPKSTPWYLWVVTAAVASAALAMLSAWFKRRFTKAGSLSPKAS